MSYFADRVRETTTTTGTGDITLAGAVSAYQTFNTGVGTGLFFGYLIFGGTEWEVGFGYLSASSTLVRTRVTASSNGGSAVNFSAGTKEVVLTITAEHAERAEIDSVINMSTIYSAVPYCGAL